MDLRTVAGGEIEVDRAAEKVTAVVLQRLLEALNRAKLGVRKALGAVRLAIDNDVHAEHLRNHAHRHQRSRF